MTKILGLPLTGILLTVVVASAQQTSPAKPPQTAEKILIANERALHEAVAKADKAAFASLVLPDGVWTTRQGFVPMKLLSDTLNVFNLTKWEMVNPGVRMLGKDSAIVFYLWTGTGTFRNQLLAPTTLASTVWTERNGKWIAVHHQETDLTK